MVIPVSFFAGMASLGAVIWFFYEYQEYGDGWDLGSCIVALIATVASVVTLIAGLLEEGLLS